MKLILSSFVVASVCLVSSAFAGGPDYQVTLEVSGLESVPAAKNVLILRSYTATRSLGPWVCEDGSFGGHPTPKVRLLGKKLLNVPESGKVSVTVSTKKPFEATDPLNACGFQYQGAIAFDILGKCFYTIEKTDHTGPAELATCGTAPGEEPGQLSPDHKTVEHPGFFRVTLEGYDVVAGNSSFKLRVESK